MAKGIKATPPVSHPISISMCICLYIRAIDFISKFGCSNALQAYTRLFKRKIRGADAIYSCNRLTHMHENGSDLHLQHPTYTSGKLGSSRFNALFCRSLTDTQMRKQALIFISIRDLLIFLYILRDALKPPLTATYLVETHYFLLKRIFFKCSII